MDLVPSSNNERVASSILKEIHGPNYLRDNVMLLEMPNSKALKEEFSSIDFLWLRRNAPWPKLVKSAVYRFLHLHNLYQVDRDDEVKKLVDYIFQEGGLQNDRHCREQMVHRCRKLILSTSQWTRTGLLVFDKDNRLVKSAIFQNAWNNQILIMSIRNLTSNCGNTEQLEDSVAVEGPNSPTKVLLPSISSDIQLTLPLVSEAKATPDLFVEVSSPVSERQLNATFAPDEVEPEIKVDPDGPMSLNNERPEFPPTLVLDDATSNVADVPHSPASYCHGLPDFGFDIPASTTQVTPSPKSTIRNVEFLKNIIQHNYPSEAMFLCQRIRFEASAYLLVHATNESKRITSYSAVVLMWQSDAEFLRFWRSLFKPCYALIEFKFSSAPWLSGFTIDVNTDDGITKARQHIWDGFWIFIDRESKFANPKFNIIAKPKLPYLPSVSSKRSIATDGTHNLKRPCPRGGEKESSLSCTKESAVSPPRSGNHASNGNTASCEGGRSLTGSPKRPVRRPRNAKKQRSILPAPSNAPINPVDLHQQQQQQQQRRSHQCLSTIVAGDLRSQFNLPSGRSTDDLTFETQPNHLNLQPQVTIPLTGTIQFLHARSDAGLPNTHPGLPNTHPNPYQHLQQYAYTQSSSRIAPQRPLFSVNYPAQLSQNPFLRDLAMAASQMHPSLANCPQQVSSHPAPSPLPPPISPQSHDLTADSICKLKPIPTIQFRIQLSLNGPFSTPYPKSILGVPGNPPLTTAQLFSWFVNETRMGYHHRLDSLIFRLKDAVPAPVSYTVSRSGHGGGDGADAIAKLRADLRRECENAGRLVMGLEVFEVFVGMVTEEGSGMEGMTRRNQILGEAW
ncbi:hypothetical protein DSL72_006354 [Monilinia vaccinii-corymbosi]|uniref:Uncharacterized protein n=1 Tax=Monilinia vaccinii-corymbosi TaxID=61207 RepID=A0A8A3PNG4_9HELO|nr:hypothetical protein DSL72_006354 [Monilinia vaccinii-corymbosi]